MKRPQNSIVKMDVKILVRFLHRRFEKMSQLSSGNGGNEIIIVHYGEWN